jgi:hypothetical protein
MGHADFLRAKDENIRLYDGKAAIIADSFTGMPGNMLKTPQIPSFPLLTP